MTSRGARALRLLRGSGARTFGGRLRAATELLLRLGPRGFARVLRETIEGPLPARSDQRPHPPADGPPAPIPRDGPLISVLVAGRATLSNQSYDGWELVCEEVRPGEGKAAALERALSAARGEWVLELIEGDRLGRHALAWVAALAEDPVDLIYSDEDVMTSEGQRRAPRFKPGWSPRTLLALPYAGRLAAVRRDLLVEVGGYRQAHEGAYHYDLLLRVGERARAVERVPRILYHARSPWPAPSEAGRAALADALARRGEVGSISREPSGYRVRRALRETPRVAIIIPTRDRRDLLERCLESHWALTRYPRCEVLVVDNGSGRPTRGWLESLQAAGRLRVLRDERPFDFSGLMNAAAARVDAEVLVFLNNDTEVLSPGWIEAMLEYALRPDVGAVGARLLLPDDRVQHAGVVLGVGPDRIAGEAHRGAEADAEGYLGRVRLVHDCAAVSAACMMVRREAFESVLGFDPELKVSFGDVDLCLRLGLAGLATVYTPYACLRHVGSASRARATDPLELTLMRERWGDLLADDPFYSPHLTRSRLDGLWD